MNNFKFYKNIFKSFLFCCFNFQSVLFCAVDEKKLNDFSSELEEDLTEVISEKLQNQKKLEEQEGKNIGKKVKKEIQKQTFKDAKNNFKNKIYGDREYDHLADEVFVYKLPTWPFYSLFYMQKDLLQFDVAFDFASKGYTSSWTEKDLSKIIFGQNKSRYKDILLVSKLLASDKVNPGGVIARDKLYFYILANQRLGLNCSFNRQTFSLNFARHFWRGSGSFGFQLPVVRRENKIGLTNEVSYQKFEQLQNAKYPPNEGPDFFTDYGDLHSFFEDILAWKDMSFHKKDTQVGVGDFLTFLNFEIDWKSCERLVLGLSVLFPTAKGFDTSKLWNAQLGNGGFFEMAFFSGILFHENRLLNPHIFLKGTVSLPHSVNRRVPKFFSYDGEDPKQGTSLEDDVIYGDYAIYKNAFKKVPDSTLKYFADHRRRVNITPGPELEFRLGNIFEKFLWNRAFLDIFYDFRIKGKDYVRNRDGDIWDYSVLTQDTYQVENNLGLNFSYQFDNHFRTNLGMTYAFAGANVPETWKFDISLNLEF